MIAADCVIPSSVHIESDVEIGTRTLFLGGATSVRSRTVIEPACIIGADITIGQGAYLRTGSVVLKSVPPNAIVEGNPAQIVGYVTGTQSNSSSTVIIQDISAFAGLHAPAKLELSVGGSAFYLMRRAVDARGSLTVGEVDQELPFQPKRYFLVFDVPSSELRGEHAHKVCHQFLICTHGSCRVLLDDGSHRTEITLDRPDIGIHMPPMIWGTQYRYSDDAVLLVFASHTYDPEDYLRTYDDFLLALDERSK